MSGSSNGPANSERSGARPVYISGALLACAEQQGIRIEHIQLGKPQQNAYVECYNRTVRCAWLARTLFDSIEQGTYNHERPNTALGGITPIQKLALAASSTVGVS